MAVYFISLVDDSVRFGPLHLISNLRRKRKSGIEGEEYRKEWFEICMLGLCMEYTGDANDFRRKLCQNLCFCKPHVKYNGYKLIKRLFVFIHNDGGSSWWRLFCDLSRAVKFFSVRCLSCMYSSVQVL